MITITKEKDQSYSTVDLSKCSSTHVYHGFYKAIADNIAEKFFCLFGNKSVMLVDSAMLHGLKESGVLQYYLQFITWIER